MDARTRRTAGGLHADVAQFPRVRHRVEVRGPTGTRHAVVPEHRVDHRRDLELGEELLLDRAERANSFLCEGEGGKHVLLGHLDSTGLEHVDSILGTGDHQIEVGPGDTVLLASSLIPGNENAVYRVINGLARLGANVVHKGNALVHVSGHASAGELLYCYNIVRPSNVLPIHGEIRHMRANADKYAGGLSALDQPAGSARPCRLWKP